MAGLVLQTSTEKSEGNKDHMQQFLQYEGKKSLFCGSKYVVHIYESTYFQLF